MVTVAPAAMLGLGVAATVVLRTVLRARVALAMALPVRRMAGQVVTRPVVRALPTAAPVPLEQVVRVARSPAVSAAEALPTALLVVRARVVVRVVGTLARPVAVRPVPVRVALATALLVQATRRVTPVAVQLVPGTAVLVVTLRVPRLRVRLPQVVPVLPALRTAVPAVPVVLPTPVLVRPVRVARVQQVRAVLLTPVPVRPVVLVTAVPVVLVVRAVPVEQVRPAVGTVRAVRAATPTLPPVPVRAERVVIALVRAVTPPRVRTRLLVVRRPVAVRPVARAVTPRRRVGMALVRPVRRPLRQVTVARAPSVATQGPAELGLSVVLAVLQPQVLVVRVVPVAPVGLRPRGAVVLSAPIPASIPARQQRRRAEPVGLSRRPRRPGLRRTTATRRVRARQTRVTRPPVSLRVGSAPTRASMSAARTLAPSISATTTRASSTTVTCLVC